MKVIIILQGLKQLLSVEAGQLNRKLKFKNWILFEAAQFEFNNESSKN